MLAMWWAKLSRVLTVFRVDTQIVQVLKMADAHEARLAKLQERISLALLPKQTKLVQLRETLRSKIESVQNARLAIERETIMDCEAVLERLRAAESPKISILAQVKSPFLYGGVPSAS